MAAGALCFTALLCCFCSNKSAYINKQQLREKGENEKSGGERKIGTEEARDNGMKKKPKLGRGRGEKKKRGRWR